MAYLPFCVGFDVTTWRRQYSMVGMPSSLVSALFTLASFESSSADLRNDANSSGGANPWTSTGMSKCATTPSGPCVCNFQSSSWGIVHIPRPLRRSFFQPSSSRSTDGIKSRCPFRGILQPSSSSTVGFMSRCPFCGILQPRNSSSGPFRRILQPSNSSRRSSGPFRRILQPSNRWCNLKPFGGTPWTSKILAIRTFCIGVTKTSVANRS